MLFASRNPRQSMTSNKVLLRTNEGTFTSLHKSNGELLSGLELEEEHPKDFSHTYSKDRFFLAYRSLIYNGIPTRWTDYNEGIADELIPEENTDVEIFPNPTYEKANGKNIQFSNHKNICNKWPPGYAF